MKEKKSIGGENSIIYDGGNLIELAKLLVMSNTGYSDKSDFPFPSHNWALIRRLG